MINCSPTETLASASLANASSRRFKQVQGSCKPAMRDRGRSKRDSVKPMHGAGIGWIILIYCVYMTSSVGLRFEPADRHHAALLPCGGPVRRAKTSSAAPICTLQARVWKPENPRNPSVGLRAKPADRHHAVLLPRGGPVRRAKTSSAAPICTLQARVWKPENPRNPSVGLRAKPADRHHAVLLPRGGPVRRAKTSSAAPICTLQTNPSRLET